MTPESALRLARELYSPFVSAGLIDEKSVQAAANIIHNHVELDEVLAKISALETAHD